MSFEARYDGECTVCDRVIRRRDRLVWLDPETVAHEHCAEDGNLEAASGCTDD